MRSWTRSLVLGLALSGHVALAAAAGAPIVEAARAGDRAAVQRLLQAGTAVNAPAVDGTTALHWAADADHLELARLLIKAGADTNAVNRYGVTPLSAAAQHGGAAMLSLLLDAG